jgi:toxin-antitoxin system PIN domain toxin
VILVDANVLLYAYDSSSPQHDRARTWLETALADQPDVRIALVTLLAFVRIATNVRLFTNPFDVDEAAAIVASWLALPNVSIAEPTSSHWPAMAAAAKNAQVSGPGVMDAHVAALALASGATLCTSDKGFARFDGLKRIDPISDPR